jgi:hypothetical protein
MFLAETFLGRIAQDKHHIRQDSTRYRVIWHVAFPPDRTWTVTKVFGKPWQVGVQRFSWVIVTMYISLLKKGLTTGHETPVQCKQLLAVLQQLVRACASHLPSCLHLSPLLRCYSWVKPVSYSTFQSLAHTTVCAKTLGKSTNAQCKLWIPPTEQRAQTLSEASSSGCCWGGGAVPSALLTAASFSASLCSSALWPLSLHGTDNSEIRSDADWSWSQGGSISTVTLINR